MIITSAGKAFDELEPLRSAGIQLVEMDAAELDLGLVVDQLAGAGLARLLCEGGPGLHRDLIAAGLLDELLLTVSPVVVGGQGLRSTSGAAIDPTADFDLRIALYADDGTLFTAYRRRSP